jgi:cytochrome c oxidase subunit 2
MRILILEFCAVLVAGVFAAMFVAIWGTRRSAGRLEHFRQSATVEVVWAAIPCLMLIAAALPAARLIVATSPPIQAKAAPAPRPAILADSHSGVARSAEFRARRE